MMKGLPARILISVIEAYRKHISPLLGANCKYSPTCSAYAIEAIKVHGAGKGSLLAIWRILRCNPFAKGGYDPVPPKTPRVSWNNTDGEAE